MIEYYSCIIIYHPNHPCHKWSHCHQLLEYSTMRAPHKMNSSVIFFVIYSNHPHHLFYFNHLYFLWWPRLSKSANINSIFFIFLFAITWSSSMGVALWMANMLNEETLAGRKLEGTTASPFHRSPWQKSNDGVHLYIRRTEITCDVADL